MDIAVLLAPKELLANGTAVGLDGAMGSQMFPVIHRMTKGGLAGATDQVALLPVDRLHVLISLAPMLKAPLTTRLRTGVLILLELVGVPHMAIPIDALDKAGRALRTLKVPLILVRINVIQEGVVPLKHLAAGLAGEFRSRFPLALPILGKVYLTPMGGQFHSAGESFGAAAAVKELESWGKIGENTW